MKPEVVESHEIRLRPFRDDDATDLTAGCTDPLTLRFMPGLPAPYTEADARWWISTGAPAVWADGGAAFAVADPDSDRLLGGAGLSQVVAYRGQAEVGYWVAPWARGRGVATAATRALADHAFAAGIGRLELLTDQENPASQRVALAAGFHREGLRRSAGPARGGGRRDLITWVRLAGDPDGPTDRILPDLPSGGLTDGVVTLRRLGPGDADVMYRLHTVPDVVATSVPPVAPARATVELRCARAESRWLAGERADLVIVDAAVGEPTGEIGLYYQEPQTGQAMIGYCMLPAWRGRGFPTRAVRLLARWAFTHSGVARLIAGTLPNNAGSQRVLEKAGFVREGCQRGRLPGIDGGRVDDVLFGLLPGDLADRPV